MTNRVVTGEVAIQMLEKAVEERGAGYVYNEHYNGCEYYGTPREGGEAGPACIVGLGVTLLFPEVSWSHLNGGTVAGTIRDRWIIGHLLLQGIELTNHAVVVLSTAQYIQDTGGTWGVARSAAEAAHRALVQTGTPEVVYHAD